MGKYLDFYKKCMKTGKLPKRRFSSVVPSGLCNDRTVGHGVSEWFAPDAPSLFDNDNGGYWGTEIKDDSREYVFCARRQNMVLLLAAIHDEL